MKPSEKGEPFQAQTIEENHTEKFHIRNFSLEIVKNQKGIFLLKS